MGIVTVRTPVVTRTMIISTFMVDMADKELWMVENSGAVAIARLARLAYDTLIRLAEDSK